MNSRFDLEKTVATWRHYFAQRHGFLREDLDELERHVRDHFRHLAAQGLSQEEAFDMAVREVGDFEGAAEEYRKVFWGKVARRRRLTDELSWRLSMLKNYLTVAVRSLLRHKGYTAINVFGLAVGLACFILIGLFVRFELSYDSFHEKADRIYRIVKEDPGNLYLGTNQFAVTSAPMATALMDEFPEVEYAVQINPNGVLLARDNTRFFEEGLYATQHFFEVFSFALLQGNRQTALAEPNSIILTMSLARKYFDDADPMGQTLTHVQGSEEDVLTVTGIVADPPENSHLAFDFLLSMATSDQYRELLASDEWDSNNYLTYVSLRPGYVLPDFEKKLVALAQNRLGQIDYYQKNPDKVSIYYPQRLQDIHLHSRLNFEAGDNGDIKYVYLFSAIGLLILLIACINYMNLATARSALRAKEVGVRKVMGAHRMQLAGQFMGESAILTGLALLLAVLLAYLLLPVFNMLTAREMSLGWVEQPGFWLAIVGVGVVVSLLSGSFPAFVISGFDPAGVMKGVLQHQGGKATLRNVLVVAQFAITTVLVVGTITVYQQLHYIRTANTGMDRDHVVLIQVPDRSVQDQYESLKQTLAQHPNVLSVTASGHNPTQIGSAAGATSWEGAEEGQHIWVYHMAVQPGFIEMFGIEFAEGRPFSADVSTDEREGMIINETMARQLGWEAAVGKWFNFQGREMRIVGVMKDFNFQSFHQAVEPLAFYVGEDRRRVLVKVRSAEMQETLAHLKATMAAFSPAYPFEYEFLDDAYNRMYRTEVRLGSLFGYLAGLALLIACLGLIGLAAHTAARRTKEIGIRKVMGAPIAGIVALLTKDFLKLVLIAFILGAPLAYFAMRRWLEDFAYHIDLGPGVFLLAGGMALTIAFLTVSYQAIKAATADPVKALRYE